MDYILNKVFGELSNKVTPVNFLDVAGKLGFFFYWLHDNLQILSKLKLVSLDANK